MTLTLNIKALSFTRTNVDEISTLIVADWICFLSMPVMARSMHFVRRELMTPFHDPDLGAVHFMVSRLQKGSFSDRAHLLPKLFNQSGENLR